MPRAGIHIPEALVHGFRASPAGRSRNDMLDEWAQSSGSIAAGYVDRDAGHKISITRRQKTDHLGLVRRLGDASERRLVDLGLLVLRARLVPAWRYALGQGAARRDRIAVDVIGPELEGELPGEGDDAAFRGGIGARRRRAEPAPGDRGEIDDLAAALLLHDWHDRVGEQERAVQIELDQLLPVGEVQLVDIGAGLRDE